MTRSPVTGLRTAVLGLGVVAGVLLVHAFDEGNAGRDLPLAAGHAAFGLILAAAAMPGPILASFVGPAAGERARGLVVGGCAVTAFVAALGGALALRRAAGAGGGPALWFALAWCALALPSAAVDAWRLRAGDGGADGAPLDGK